MRVTLVWCLLTGVLALVGVNSGCSRSAVCDSATGLSDTTLNPNGSNCTQACECNNLTHFGTCLNATCLSFARARCDVKGERQPCQIRAELAQGTCLEGVRTCQPEGLKERYWSACQPDCSCSPGEIGVCYSGSAESVGLGVCKAGNRVCRADKSWGPCNGEILPTAERCNGQDDDCNGKTDDNCTPSPEATDEKPPEASVEKPADASVEKPTDASGEKPGDKSVEKPSDARGEPVTTPEESGAREPVLELDEAPDTISEPSLDASGEPIADAGGEVVPESVREVVPEPQCVVGATRVCYTGPVGTAGNGLCKAGTQTCDSGGMWGGCSGEVTPTFERCDGLDRDCDGKVSKAPSNGVHCVATFAGARLSRAFSDGPVDEARFSSPVGVAWYAGSLFVADSGNHCIRKVAFVSNGVCQGKSGYTGLCVSSYAGQCGTPNFANGTAATALFNDPNGLAFDSKGNLFVADANNHSIRMLKLVQNATCGSTSGYTGVCVTTIAGGGQRGSTDGPGGQARFQYPRGVVVNATGILYVADTNNHRIRKVEMIQNGTCGTTGNYTGYCVTTLAGSQQGFADGFGVQALFQAPQGLAVDATGALYVADSNNHRIRKINASGKVTTVAGSGAIGTQDGSANTAQFNRPHGLVVDKQGLLTIADSGNHLIRTFCSSATSCLRGVATYAGVGLRGFLDGLRRQAYFYSPRGLALDTSQNLYVADTLNHRVRKIDQAGKVTTYGTDPNHADGGAMQARLHVPNGLAFDSKGNLFIADEYNHRIRMIDTNGQVTTIAGRTFRGIQDGPGASALFYSPHDLVIDKDILYVSDKENHRIRKLEQVQNATCGTSANYTGWCVSTLTGGAGLGFVDGVALSAKFAYPQGLTLHKGALYVADRANHRIRKLEKVTNRTCGSNSGYTGWCVSTVVGDGSKVDKEGPALQVGLSSPGDLTISSDGKGTMYITQESRIRKVAQVTNAVCGSSSNYTGACVSFYAGGATSGFGDGPGASAKFSSLGGVVVGPGGALYVADSGNHRLRKLEMLTNGTCGANSSYTGVCVSTLAGAGQGFREGGAQSALFFSPRNLVFHPTLSNVLYVSDSFNHLIRRIFLSP